MKELPHPGATESDAGSEDFALTELEVGDGFLRIGDRRTLASDLLDLIDGVIHGNLAVWGLAHAGGDDDLFQAGDLMDVGVSELLLESRNYLFKVVLL